MRLDGLARAPAAMTACAALALAPTSAPASAATPYVDGISDQSMPAWNGSFGESDFAQMFSARWVTGGHIRYARYVVQWDVMQEPTAGPSPDGDYRERLEAWYADASSLGLTLDVALTSYDGSAPSGPAQYAQQLTELLQAFPLVRYVEAWNEPNNSPYLAPPAAAGLANAAEAVCRARGACTVIVGDLLDGANEVSYEREYERYLEPADPPDWGLHPYYAVRDFSESPVQAYRRNLPGAGAGIALWFTEVGAYYCTDYGGRLEDSGEAGQEAHAYWLTHLLMPNAQPAHVFYFEFLYASNQSPPCTAAQADTSLYAPSGDPAAPVRARAAATTIYGAQAPAGGYAQPPPEAAGVLGWSAVAPLPF
jgi:hypothetical protein